MFTISLNSLILVQIVIPQKVNQNGLQIQVIHRYQGEFYEMKKQHFLNKEKNVHMEVHNIKKLLIVNSQKQYHHFVQEQYKFIQSYHLQKKCGYAEGCS